MGISAAIPESDRARTLGILVSPGDNANDQVVNLPQRVAILAQGSDSVTYSLQKAEFTSAQLVGETYGFGSPAHLAALQLQPPNRDGIGAIPMTVYPVEKAVAGVPAAGNITPTGTQSGAASYVVNINEIFSEAFVINDGEQGTDLEQRIADAINANINMPVIAVSGANVINLTAKSSGTTGNQINVAVIGPTNGITFGIVQPSGGLVNGDVDPALAQMGEVWESMVLNCFEIDDALTLDKLQTHGEGRWGPKTRKPYVSFVGNNIANVALAYAVADTRPLDRINGQLVSPGSNDLDYVIAARQLARIATLANHKPATDYGSLQATGLTPGLDGDQWDYEMRDAALKHGSSSVQVRDGVVNLSDIVTFYHPTGEVDPPYRYVVDIVKLQNILFNIDRRFNVPEWDGAPLLPDGDFTTERDAKFPSTAKTEIADVTTQLGLKAILSDVKNTNQGIQVVISDSNPKRLDAVIPVKLSGNVNIFSIDLLFSFFFGSPEIRTS